MMACATLLLASSVISIGAVQSLGPRLRRYAGPRIAYACWLLPWLSAAVSLLPNPLLSIATGSPAYLLPAAIGRLAAHAVEGELGACVAVIWGTAAVLFLTLHLAAYRAFVAAASRHSIELERQGGIRIHIGPNVPVPFAAGILRRRIFLPAAFDTVFSPDEQRMIVRHEQAHHQRHDIAANLLALITMSLHWWNPLAYAAHRRFRADQELACDATVITGLGRADRYAYGMAILKCAKTPRLTFAAAMSGRFETSIRLTAIASEVPRGAAPMLALLPAAALLAVLALLQGAIVRPILPAVAGQAVASSRAVALPPDVAGNGTPDLCDGAPSRRPDLPSLARFGPARPAEPRTTLARLDTAPAEGWNAPPT